METEQLETSQTADTSDKLPQIHKPPPQSMFNKKRIIKGLTPRVIQNTNIQKYLEL